MNLTDIAQRYPQRPTPQGMSDLAYLLRNKEYSNPMPVDIMKQPQFSTKGAGGGGDKSWLLKALLAAGILGLSAATRRKPPKKAPGGYTMGEKPLAAQALRAAAQAVEKKAESKRLIEQAKAEQEKEQWERDYKMFVEQMKQLRHEQTIAQQREAAGMRYAPEEMTPQELQEHEMKIKEAQSRIDENRAQVANYYDMISKRKNADDPLAQALGNSVKAFGDLDNLKTVTGKELGVQITGAWQEFLNTGDDTNLLVLNESLKMNIPLLETYSDVRAEQMVNKQGQLIDVGKRGITEKSAPDRGILTTIMNTLLTEAQRLKSYGGGGGIPQTQTQPVPKSKYPETRAGAIQAWNDGNYEEAVRIGNKTGMSPDDFRQ